MLPCGFTEGRASELQPVVLHASARQAVHPLYRRPETGLDVWLSEKDPNWALASHPAVSCTPHIGAGTKEAQKRIGAELVDIVENFG